MGSFSSDFALFVSFFRQEEGGSEVREMDENGDFWRTNGILTGVLWSGQCGVSVRAQVDWTQGFYPGREPSSAAVDDLVNAWSIILPWSSRLGLVSV